MDKSLRDCDTHTNTQCWCCLFLMLAPEWMGDGALISDKNAIYCLQINSIENQVNFKCLDKKLHANWNGRWNGSRILNEWMVNILDSGYRSLSVEFGSSKKKILSHKVKSMQRNMNCKVVIPRVESSLRIFSDKMNGIKCCQRLSINQWTRLILTDRVYLSSP